MQAIPSSRPSSSVVIGSEQQRQEHLQRLSQKFQNLYEKRVQEHGPRRFRWPDGSLRSERPPANPFAVANRKKYAPLVAHCRRKGGDRNFETTGCSWRYGIGVSHKDHVNYLKLADLEPEVDESGEWLGFDPNKTDPLKDPAHALNSFYKEGAEEVFRHARGRLL